MKAIDISGQRYGHLTAIARAPNKGRRTRWSFQCDCGEQTIADLDFVRRGVTSSCGCQSSRVAIGKRSLKHGHSVGFKKSRTAAAWHNAKTRCFNPNSKKHPRYGERGITMCAEWADDFSAFLLYMGECPPGMMLERKDNDGNYEPENCIWASPSDQANNKSTNIIVEFEGRRLTLSRFAAANSVNYKRLHRRVHDLGETPAEAVRWIKMKDAQLAAGKT